MLIKNKFDQKRKTSLDFISVIDINQNKSNLLDYYWTRIGFIRVKIAQSMKNKNIDIPIRDRNVKLINNVTLWEITDLHFIISQHATRDIASLFVTNNKFMKSNDEKQREIF